VLDLACGDGALAEHLPGLRYTGVDLSPEMVDVATRRGRDVVLGNLNDYEPLAPVVATTCFRAVYYADDREAFFRRVAGYTERKLVFDLNPRRYSVDAVRSDLRRAGFDELELRPFFSPQHRSLPLPAIRLLHALERSGPLARALLALRFSYVCAAYRGGRKM
jgi:SAM-dependent methyltransferase